jgi:ATP-dependent 26S proteasome regulatory subunit
MSDKPKPDGNKKDNDKKDDIVPINPTEPVGDPEEFYSSHIWGGKSKRAKLVRYAFYPLWDMVSTDFKIYQFQSLPKAERVKQAHKYFDWTLRHTNYGSMPNKEDIVGRDAEINVFINSIHYHILRDPEALKMKRPPPKLFLVKGDTGSGKTFLIQAVVKEAFQRAMEEGFIIDLTQLDAAKVASPYMGVMEAAVSSIMNNAKSRPTFLWIEEANQLTGKGSTEHGDSASKAYVGVESILLQGMDDIKRMPVRTLMVLTTNAPEGVREDIRRRCYFMDLETPGLKHEDLVGIIKRLCEKWSINLDPERVMDTLEQALREAGQGKLAPGDISRAFDIVVEEAEKPIRESFTKKLEGRQIDPLPITYDMFKAAGSQIRAYKAEKINEQVKQSEQTLVPRETFADVGGLKKIKEEIIKEITLSLHPEKASADWEPPRGYLFYGPPGTGKTLITKAIAHHNKVPFFLIKGPSMLQGIVGESEKNMRQVFQQARAKSPSIIFMDEIDAVGAAGHRDNQLDSGVSRNVLLTLLTELDGFNPKGRVVFIGATNRRDVLDRALLERLDKQFEFSYPKTTEEKLGVIRALWRRQIEKTGITPEDILRIFIKRTFSPRSCHDMITEALRYVEHERNGCRDLIEASDQMDVEKIKLTREIHMADFARIQERMLKSKDEFALDEEYRKIAANNPITIFHLEKALEEKYETDAVKEQREMQEIHRSRTGEIGTGYGLAVSGDQTHGMMLILECIIFPAAKKGEGTVHPYGNVGVGSQESANMGRDLLKSINPLIANLDFSIHTVSSGEGGEQVAVSGPSAGMVMFFTMLSTIIKEPFNPDVCMTGKIDLRGTAGLVGGIQPDRGAQKIDAARENGFKQVIIPQYALDKLQKDWPDYVLMNQEAGLSIVGGKNVQEYSKYVFPNLTWEQIVAKIKGAVTNGS